MTSIDYFKVLSRFYADSGFYFVPTLVLIGLFNLKSLKANKARIVYFILAISLALFYLLAGSNSSRYLLIPFFIIGCIAGSGLELISKLLAKATKKTISSDAVASFLVCIIVIASFLKFWTHERTECMQNFAAILSNNSYEGIVYGVSCNSSKKLKGLLDARKDLHYVGMESWDETMQSFIHNQYDGRDYFFCIEMPKKYTIPDYKKWFQSLFYVFPFTVVAEDYKGSKRFALLKFNGMTFDGKEKGFDTDLFTNMPSALPLKKWQLNFSSADLKEFLPKDIFRYDSFFEVSNGTIVDTLFFTRPQFNNTPYHTLTLRNDVFWPRSSCQIQFEEKQSFHKKLSTNKNDHKIFFGPRANTPPLDLFPEDSPIVLDSSNPFLHLSGALPGWFADVERYVFNDQNDEIFHVSSDSEYIDLLVEDHFLHSSVQKRIKPLFATDHDDSSLPQSILIIKGAGADYFKIKDNISSNLPQSCTIDLVSLSHTSLSSFSPSTFPKKKYDMVIIDLFVNFINLPLDLPFETDIWFDKDFNSFFTKICSLYSESNYMFLLPPTPAPAPTMYPICNSSRLGKLSHYRVCSAALRWYSKIKSSKTILVPLYLYLDPQNDYTNQWTINKVRVKTGYQITGEAQNKIAHIIDNYMTTVSFK